MDQLARLWDEILATQRHSMFQLFSWNRLAAEILRERVTPMVVAVESDRGAAIVPASRRVADGVIELLGEALFDYRDVLHIGEAEVLRMAWQRVGETGSAFWAQAIEADAARQRWREFRLQEFAKAPWVDRESVSEHQFRSAHSRVGRHLRRMQKRGVELKVYSGTDSEMVRRVYELKCDQFAGDPNNIFRDSRRREFMVAVCGWEGKNSELFILQDGVGCIVAGLVTFRDQDIRRFYTIYFDPAWAAYSPGIVLVFEVTARSLAEGLSCDYMTGEYPYKLRFANASRQLWRIDTTADEMLELVQRTCVHDGA